MLCGMYFEYKVQNCCLPQVVYQNAVNKRITVRIIDCMQLLLFVMLGASCETTEIC